MRDLYGTDDLIFLETRKNYEQMTEILTKCKSTNISISRGSLFARDTLTNYLVRSYNMPLHMISRRKFVVYTENNQPYMGRISMDSRGGECGEDRS
jgi:hypothetical protein